jgi:hypothetical protein
VKLVLNCTLKVALNDILTAFIFTSAEVSGISEAYNDKDKTKLSIKIFT